ncbi:carbohydrate ABC transporter permease [Paenibacillus sp. J5C_2022]|uniref:carbohydrate ABC transporter permease n=1 Tax=Paenibacillus sp. J5C2022 TaxID=2977129 RepID=UPI0021CF3EE0|nr:carbohydrate ABC transporter permease [Paenibacillus sp. J5C2022]MCU6712573.1 carbohydrate ABC transporter permease [Paenibacillus sp. J5C2022]
MVEQASWSRKLFVIFNYLFLSITAILCLAPIIHVLSISLSSMEAVASGQVTLWPVDFTLSAYEYALTKEAFSTSLFVSVKRVILGTSLQMIMIVLLAYPLSKEDNKFKFRTLYVWIVFITVLISGGLIPYYMTIRYTGLLDSIWALVIPISVPVFSVVLLLNFFRGLPKELEESAFMDGAGHFTTLWSIFVPLSKPALATLLLFSMVGHWNSWFDGLIFMNSADKYPLQSYLQTIVVNTESEILTEAQAEMMKELSNRTFKAAQIFIGALPILLVYPFLQKHFMKGIVLGSVKG